MEADGIALAKRGIEAFNSGDIDALEALTTSDLRIVPIRAALEDIAYEGPDAWREFWAEIAHEWSEIALDLDEFEQEGEVVTARGVLRATARASGAKVEMRVVSTFVVRGELLAEVRTVPA